MYLLTSDTQFTSSGKSIKYEDTFDALKDGLSSALINGFTWAIECLEWWNVRLFPWIQRENAPSAAPSMHPEDAEMLRRLTGRDVEETTTNAIGAAPADCKPPYYSKIVH